MGRRSEAVLQLGLAVWRVRFQLLTRTDTEAQLISTRAYTLQTAAFIRAHPIQIFANEHHGSTRLAASQRGGCRLRGGARRLHSVSACSYAFGMSLCLRIVDLKGAEAQSYGPAQVPA